MGGVISVLRIFSKRTGLLLWVATLVNSKTPRNAVRHAAPISAFISRTPEKPRKSSRRCPSSVPSSSSRTWWRRRSAFPSAASTAASVVARRPRRGKRPRVGGPRRVPSSSSTCSATPNPTPTSRALTPSVSSSTTFRSTEPRKCAVTYRAHGRINAYMSSPCHVEMILQEREVLVAKNAGRDDQVSKKKESKKKIARQKMQQRE